MRYKSARQMIFDAYQSQRGSVMAAASEIAQLGARVQTTQRNNNDWRIVHGLEAGAVISRVESLPPHLQALARYCFGPFTREELAEDRETVEIALYHQLLADGVKLPGQGKGKPTAQQLETLRYLCAAALYHHSEVTWPYSRQGLHTPKVIREWLFSQHGVELNTRFWTRVDRVTWRDAWDSALFILDNWECFSMKEVSSLLVKAA